MMKRSLFLALAIGLLTSLALRHAVSRGYSHDYWYLVRPRCHGLRIRLLFFCSGDSCRQLQRCAWP